MLKGPLILVISLYWVALRGSSTLMNSQLFDQRLSTQPDRYTVLPLEGLTRVVRGLRPAYKMTPPVPLEFLHFLFTSSPQHHFLIVYDETFSGTNKLIQSCSNIWTEYTVIGIRNDIMLLHYILTYPLISAPTVRRHIFTLCSVENVNKIFEMVVANNLESPFDWWIIFVTEEFPKFHLEKILREGSQVIIIQKESNIQLRIMSSAIDVDNKIGFQDTGTWTSLLERQNQPSLVERLFKDISNDFRGRLLTVAANNAYPYVVFEEKENGVLELGVGIDANIVRVLSEYLNFTYRVVTPEDGGWGGPLPNGTVTGMIGLVSRREAHFAVTEITITRSRETVTDFTAPYYIESLTMASQRPKQKNRAFATFSTFTSQVWLCIAVSTLAVGLFLTPETWLMNKYLKVTPDGFDVNNSLFNAFRSLVKQDNLLSSPYWPHRFVLLFWYLFCLIISALYSGMLIATLVRPSFEKPIDSLTDLPDATDNGFTLQVMAGTSHVPLFQDAKQGLYAQTWKLFNHEDKAQSFIPSVSYGMDRVLDNKGIYIGSTLISKFNAVQKGFRRYHFARDSFAMQHYGIPCHQGAPFRSKFSDILQRINEGALITKWINDEFQKLSDNGNVEDQDSGAKAFTLRHLQAAFYILLIGSLIAVMAFIIELLAVYL